MSNSREYVEIGVQKGQIAPSNEYHVIRHSVRFANNLILIDFLNPALFLDQLRSSFPHKTHIVLILDDLLFCLRRASEHIFNDVIELSDVSVNGKRELDWSV